MAILVVVATLFVLLYFYLQGKNQSPPDNSSAAKSATSTPATSGSLPDENVGAGPDLVQSSPAAPSLRTKTVTPKAGSTKITSTSKTPTAKPQIATTPVGDLDWTKQPSRIIDVSKEPSAKLTLCQLSRLSDSWSKPIEKFTCDLLDFINSKIAEPLSGLTCLMAAASLQSNYDQNIKWEYNQGQCHIIDR